MLAISEEALNKIFLRAVLLTGSLNRAESAMNRAIESIENESDLDNRLTDLMIDAALSLNQTSPTRTCERECYDLPEELLRLVRLPSKLRSAFVLHMLLNLPYERCAELMDESSANFKELLCESVLALEPDPLKRLAHSRS
jgi:DNA-directed RNA polymerase specialized sigma24 family protein